MNAAELATEYYWNGAEHCYEDEAPVVSYEVAVMLFDSALGEFGAEDLEADYGKGMVPFLRHWWALGYSEAGPYYEATN